MIHPPFEFGVLGPLELRAQGAPVPVNAPKQRVVLAALLLRANRVVTLGELTEVVWDGGTPAQPTTALRVYILRLRRLLGRPEVIRTTPTGYLLEVPDHALDLHRFRDLTGRAAREAASGELERAVRLWDEALALWRAEPLLDVPSDSLRRSETPQLVEIRLRAERERIDAKLRLGEHHEVISDLRTLTSEYPLREQFWHQLMLALHRANRQAEALFAYRTVTDALAEKLGVAPGRELQDLFHAILNGDPELDVGQFGDGLDDRGRFRTLRRRQRRDEFAVAGVGGKRAHDLRQLQLLADLPPGQRQLVLVDVDQGDRHSEPECERGDADAHHARAHHHQPVGCLVLRHDTSIESHLSALARNPEHPRSATSSAESALPGAQFSRRTKVPDLVTRATSESNHDTTVASGSNWTAD